MSFIKDSLRDYHSTFILVFETMMKHLPNLLTLLGKGYVIGVAAIIPGFSGGTVALFLGIYDQLIFAIHHIRQQFLQSFAFLLPIGIGVLLAIASLSVPIRWAFEQAPLITISFFAGLIIGSLHHFQKNVTFTFNLKPILTIGIPFMLAASLGPLSVFGQLDATLILTQASVFPKLSLVLIGALAATALVIPGISGSMLLLSLGFYFPVLDSLRRLIESFTQLNLLTIDTLNFAFLGIGLLVGMVAVAATLTYLLKHQPLLMRRLILGFLWGSLLSIFYNYQMVMNQAYTNLSLITILLSVFAITVSSLVSYHINTRYATR
jgi:putative membrane protein